MTHVPSSLSDHIWCVPVAPSPKNIPSCDKSARETETAAFIESTAREDSEGGSLTGRL